MKPVDFCLHQPETADEAMALLKDPGVPRQEPVPCERQALYVIPMAFSCP